MKIHLGGHSLFLFEKNADISVRLNGFYFSSFFLKT